MSEKDDRSSHGRAAVPRQDATGLDIPAGRSADELRPEDYRPAEVTESDAAPEPPKPASR